MNYKYFSIIGNSWKQNPKERITINENGNAREVSVVRYIKNNENKYLIYTMGEIEGELQRIYIVKVLEQGELTGIRVPDEEWDEVKRLIQEIVKANRANSNKFNKPNKSL